MALNYIELYWALLKLTETLCIAKIDWMSQASGQVICTVVISFGCGKHTPRYMYVYLVQTWNQEYFTPDLSTYVETMSTWSMESFHLDYNSEVFR